MEGIESKDWDERVVIVQWQRNQRQRRGGEPEAGDSCYGGRNLGFAGWGGEKHGLMFESSSATLVMNGGGDSEEGVFADLHLFDR